MFKADIETMAKPIYLDYMATTPVDPIVVKEMIGCLDENGYFGNPASTSHCYGQEAKKRVEAARQSVAEFIQADPQEIIFTSGATEANNLAIKGAASFYYRKGKHIISSCIEHKSVLDTLDYLSNNGYEITYLEPNTNGLIQPEQVAKALRPDTILVSIMHANNEIGTIQDIEEIGKLVNKAGSLFHVDAAQTLGKLPINILKLNVDLMSFSAHKLYGPKGIGALYFRRKPRVRLAPLLHGGGHEFGLRSGTLPTHQIVGMAAACQVACDNLEQERSRIEKLRNKLWQGLSSLSDIHLNGDSEARLPGVLNVSFDYVEGEALLVGLSHLAVSSGAACNSATIEPSYVLRALGIPNERANSSIRFCIGRFTTQTDIEDTIRHVIDVVTRLRKISPMEYLCNTVHSY